MSTSRVPHLLGDIPIVSNVVSEVVDNTVGWAWDKVETGITKWVLGAVAYFVNGALDFLKTAAKPDLQAAWFSGPHSPYATVRNIAALLLLAFVFLGLIQGLLANDVPGMVRRIATDLPAAIIGMVATTIVAAKLLELTDALSTAVLSNSDDQAVHFFSHFGVSITSATQGFAAVLIGIAAVLAALFVWIELMVRSVLIYLLVAISPLSFAAMVWPAARGVLRRTLELLLALIASKLVICVALSVGVAALAGAGTAGAGPTASGNSSAISIGTLFVGTAVLALAAFAPFLVLRLIPIAEAAVVAQGTSRAPVRAAQATISNAYYANSLARLAAGTDRRAVGSPADGGGWIVGAPLPDAGGASAAGVAAGPGGAAVVAGGAAIAAGAKAVGAASEGATRVASEEGAPPDRNAPPRLRSEQPAQGLDGPDEGGRLQ
jgi:hypothetical protein